MFSVTLRMLRQTVGQRSPPCSFLLFLLLMWRFLSCQLFCVHYNAWRLSCSPAQWRQLLWTAPQQVSGHRSWLARLQTPTTTTTDLFHSAPEGETSCRKCCYHLGRTGWLSSKALYNPFGNGQLVSIFIGHRYVFCRWKNQVYQHCRVTRIWSCELL
jgi:hypothetical protein